MSWRTLMPGPVVDPSATRRAARSLTAARVLEQAALAVTLVVLARRLSVAAFGEASLAVAFQAVAITASDLGVGLALLSIPGGDPVDPHSWRRARRVNGWVLAVAALAAMTAPMIGSRAVAVAVAGTMWWSSAHAYVAKAATLRARHPGAVARAEIVSSLAFLALALVTVTDDLPFVGLGAAYIVRNLIEAGLLRGWASAAFAVMGTPLRSRWVWVTQVVSYATSNVDYLVVGLALGPVNLGIYSLAYRAASFVPSQLSFVVNRVSIVSLADRTGSDRGAAGHRLVVRLFMLGSIAALIAFVLTPAIPGLLGDQWQPSVNVLLVLLVGVPWRLTIPVAGILALVEDKARELAPWEVARLALTVGALAVGALAGLAGIAIAATLVPILATFMLFRAMGPPATASLPRSLGPAAIGSFVLIVVIAAVTG